MKIKRLKQRIDGRWKAWRDGPVAAALFDWLLFENAIARMLWTIFRWDLYDCPFVKGPKKCRP